MDKKWKCQLQNLHTHTVYSDGRNSPEEMLLAAIEKGFSSIGFSEHSYIADFQGKWLMPEKTDEYLAELDRLKEKYKGEIGVFKGIELDSYSELLPTDCFDYVIGNVHFCPRSDGKFVEYCRNSNNAAQEFKFYYNCDTYAFAKDYYERFVSFFEKRPVDIVGHFDALTKFAELYPDLFNFESKEYKNIALEALHAVKEKCDLFEVNAGNMGRGIRKYPCPEPFLLKELKNIGARVLISTDAHGVDYLDKFVDEVLELLLECGFDSIWILTDHGFEEQKII